VSTASSADQTKKATISLLRNLTILIETLRPLPEDARVTTKLFYYDSVTPEDYEPPGFREAETDFICMEGNPTKFRFQGVSTPFHSLQVRDIADATMDDEEEEEAVPEQVSQQKEMTEDAMKGMDVELMKEIYVELVKGMYVELMKRVDVELVKGMYVELMKRVDVELVKGMDVELMKRVDVELVKGVDVELDDSLSVQEGVVNSTMPDLRGNASAAGVESRPRRSNVRRPGVSVSVSVRYPCPTNDDDLLMIQCSVCRYWQHAICFKILDDSLTPACHVCHLCCSSAADAEPTDAELAGVDQSEAHADDLSVEKESGCLLGSEPHQCCSVGVSPRWCCQQCCQRSRGQTGV